MKIENNTGGRRFVISDIHGCVNTFQTLLDKISLEKNDQLFLLGDYMNRGPDSAGVLNIIFNLLEQGYGVFPLKGNHEQMELDSRVRRINERDFERPRYTMWKSNLLDKNYITLQKYADFMEKLPHYYELEDCYLVHAGFNFTIPDPFSDEHSMIWIMKMRLGHTSTTDKRIIHGHMSTPLAEIEENIKNNAQIIPLDNGCYKAKPPYGNLCCLELNSFQLTVQEYIG